VRTLPALVVPKVSSDQQIALQLSRKVIKAYLFYQSLAPMVRIAYIHS
jgi:hypothetical protein